MTDSPANAHVFDATTASFEAEVLAASMETPILVDFWAEWCGPCKTLGPILEKLAADFGGAFRLAKVDTEAEPQIAGAFQIRSIPTVFLVKGGQIVDGFQGVQPESQLREFLKKHGIEPTVALEGVPGGDTAADAPVETVDPHAEVVRLRKLVDSEPDKAEHRLDLALALLKTGATTEAESLIDALPANLSTDDRAIAARSRLELAAKLKDAPPEATLRAALEADPGDLQARYLLGVHGIVSGDVEAGFAALIELLRRDRDWRDGLPRKTLIDAFRIVEDAALVSRYRRQMSSLLLV